MVVFPIISEGNPPTDGDSDHKCSSFQIYVARVLSFLSLRFQLKTLRLSREKWGLFKKR